MAPIPTRSKSRRITESQRQAGLGKGLAYGWQPQSTSKQEQNMKPRMDFYKASPGALQAMLGLEKLVDKSGIEKPLAELVRLRASQINGCAFCADMHATDARKGGETDRRLDTRSEEHTSELQSLMRISYAVFCL